MLAIGRVNTLLIDHADDRGLWLRTDGEALLLPRREAAAAGSPGETVSVFVFRDASGRLCATLRRPVAQVGEFGLLTVRSVGAYGAFLDWGVGKDLLAPLPLQPERMQVGQSYLVRIALDELGRPYASARLDDWLEETCAELRAGDAVTLVVWKRTDLGVKLIVDHRWSGVLYRDAVAAAQLRPGQRLDGFVQRVRADGRLDLTLRPVGVAGAQAAQETLLAALRASDFLPLHDQSPPEEIERLLGLSKKSFKKALGNLYKSGQVELLPAGIRRKGA